MSISTTSFIGFGSDFQRSTDGVTYATVGQIWSIEPPDGKTTIIDVTNLQSPSYTKQKRPGLLDPGEITFELIYRHQDHVVMFGDWQARSQLYYKLIWSDVVSTASTLTFSGFVSACGGAMPMDDKVLTKVTIVAVTAPVYTQGT